MRTVTKWAAVAALAVLAVVGDRHLHAAAQQCAQQGGAMRSDYTCGPAAQPYFRSK